MQRRIISEYIKTVITRMDNNHNIVTTYMPLMAGTTFNLLHINNYSTKANGFKGVTDQSGKMEKFGNCPPQMSSSH